MIETKNFNLLISTSRFNETNASAELWFTLLICGENYPIISNLTFPGLVSALTTNDAKQIIRKIQYLLKENPQYFQFILKIIPIDFVCETEVKTIVNLIHSQYKAFINEEDSFKIVLKRRKHEKIDREKIIDQIASKIDNRVDLENPDKIIRVEILGSFTGVSFLEKNDIIGVSKAD
ncbi:MAG: THUMP domain-containing protein [Promethearchaeota archaeon]